MESFSLRFSDWKVPIIEVFISLTLYDKTSILKMYKQ